MVEYSLENMNTKLLEPTDFLTTAEVAKILGYTIQHTRLLIRVSKIRGSKLGRDWLIPRQEVDAFITELRNPNAN